MRQEKLHDLQSKGKLFALVCTLLLSACRMATPESTLIGLTEATPPPASTIQPNAIASTYAPSDTPIPNLVLTTTLTPEMVFTTTVNLALPSGEPVSSWNGIPIMPGAISGEEDENGYSYTIRADAKLVQDFYNKGMPEEGWKYFATGTGETGSLLLMYQKGDKTCTISIYEQGGVSLVLIIQY